MIGEGGDRPVLKSLKCFSSLDNLGLLRAFARDCCVKWSALEWDSARIAELELAVTEAASNVIRHGYQGRNDGRILVEAEIWSDRVVLVLHSWGCAFEPGEVALPDDNEQREGGWGLYIISKCVDSVDYGSPAEGGNVVKLVKYRLKKG